MCEVFTLTRKGPLAFPRTFKFAYQLLLVTIATTRYFIVIDKAAAMVVSKRRPVNGFVRRARKIYNPIGFVKGYNFVLFFIFAGAMMGFVLGRREYLNFYGIFCGPGSSPVSHAAPGECYYYLGPSHGGAGIIMHLGTIISAVILVCFQFVPGIRHKAILAYRINGYVILVFSLVSTAGVFKLLRHAFGCTLATQYNMRYLAVVFLGSLVMAYINVKRLQVEEHRAWMLRARFYVRRAPNPIMLVTVNYGS